MTWDVEASNKTPHFLFFYSFFKAGTLPRTLKQQEAPKGWDKKPVKASTVSVRIYAVEGCVKKTALSQPVTVFIRTLQYASGTHVHNSIRGRPACCCRCRCGFCSKFAAVEASASL